MNQHVQKHKTKMREVFFGNIKKMKNRILWDLFFPYIGRKYYHELLLSCFCFLIWEKVRYLQVSAKKIKLNIKKLS